MCHAVGGLQILFQLNPNWNIIFGHRGIGWISLRPPPLPNQLSTVGGPSKRRLGWRFVVWCHFMRSSIIDVDYKHPLFRSLRDSETLGPKSGGAMVSFYVKWIGNNVNYKLSLFRRTWIYCLTWWHAIDLSDWSLIEGVQCEIGCELLKWSQLLYLEIYLKRSLVFSAWAPLLTSVGIPYLRLLSAWAKAFVCMSGYCISVTLGSLTLCLFVFTNFWLWGSLSLLFRFGPRESKKAMMYSDIGRLNCSVSYTTFATPVRGQVKGFMVRN